MGTIKYYIVSIISVALFLFVITIIQEEAPFSFAKDMNETSECDIKRMGAAHWCPENNTLFLVFRCKHCANENCQKCRHNTIVNLSSDPEVKNIKCACCGSEILIEIEAKPGVSCLLCSQLDKECKVEKARVCIKQVYACPEHPNNKTVKSGSCDEEIVDAKGNKKSCGKKLVLVSKVYSKISTLYECPKCQARDEKAGKCETCKQVLRMKNICQSSGTFPHVNETIWEKRKTKSFGSSDKEVEMSQPEVKIFEGTRAPQLKSWTYLIYCPKAKEAALIDASCDPEVLAKFIEENKLKLRYIFVTHSHDDHLVTLTQIQAKFRDSKLLRFGSPLKDNEYIKLGKLTLKIFHTPGHWDDCIVIWVDKMLFTGDSFDHELGRRETKTRLNGKGGFTIYGGHGTWTASF